MKITIASGKGGTGKTTVATNLAWILSMQSLRVAYLDCDVEEPNGHIFLQSELQSSETVSMPVPKIDEAKCTHCGQCARTCRYSAIVCIKETILVNPSMCHGCGGCMLVCPSQAITETPWPIGIVQRGRCGALTTIMGRTQIGVAMSPPVIRVVKRACPQVDVAIFDAPPGTSCPVVETVRDSHHVVLVTEPTPFGLNDLALAVEMIRALNVPMSVIVNRAIAGNTMIDRYCEYEGIRILATIPDDRRVAEAYSKGWLIADAMPVYGSVFASIASSLLKGVRR